MLRDCRGLENGNTRSEDVFPSRRSRSSVTAWPTWRQPDLPFLLHFPFFKITTQLRFITSSPLTGFSFWRRSPLPGQKKGLFFPLTCSPSSDCVSNFSEELRALSVVKVSLSCCAAARWLALVAQRSFCCVSSNTLRLNSFCRRLPPSCVVGVAGDVTTQRLE